MPTEERLDEIEERVEEIDQRLTVIEGELEENNADVEALEEEVDELQEERSTLMTERRQIRTQLRAQRQQNRLDVASGAGAAVNMPSPTTTAQQRTYDASSPEYRRAWLRNMARDNQGNMLLGQMTAQERAAFTFTTENTGAVVPVEIQDRIVELVEATYPLVGDASNSSFTRGFGVPRHKEIKAGDAKTTVEGVANDDEEDAFDLLGLDGEEIRKHITITKKMQIKSLEAFEDWIVAHLAERIGVAKDKLILERMDEEDVGIVEKNKLVDLEASDANIRKIMGLIKGNGEVKVYANNSTIWNVLAGIKEDDGTKCFIPNSMSDPIVQGRIYGAETKKDENIADYVAWFGIPSKILTNDFDDMEIVQSVEPKTLNSIITGYSLYDAGMENPYSFVKATFKKPGEQ